MVGFLILAMVVGLASAILGIVAGAVVLPLLATTSSAELMPKLLAAYLALMLGLLLAAVAGGLADLLTLLRSVRLEWRLKGVSPHDPDRSDAQGTDQAIRPRRAGTIPN